MAKKIKKPTAVKSKNKAKPIKKITPKKSPPKNKAAVKKLPVKKVVKAPKINAKKPKEKVKVVAKSKPKALAKITKKTNVKTKPQLKIAAKKPQKNKPAAKLVTKKLPVKEVKKPAIKVASKPVEKVQTEVLPVKKEEKPAVKLNIKSTKNSSVKSSSSGKIRFSVGDYAIYPSHGVGKIVGIEKAMIMGEEKSCYLMHFEKERLNIKIPVSSADQIGLRHPISKSQMEEVFVTLRSGVKKLKGMWSRRAQEYETKINSGDIMLLAEVIRDLTRDIEDSERSYSERIIYETAIYRLTSEYVVIHGTAFNEAKDTIINTAKDKLGTEGKVVQKDEFDDEFDSIEKMKSGDDDEEEDEESEDEEEDDYDYDDDDDDKPKKKKKK